MLIKNIDIHFHTSVNAGALLQNRHISVLGMLQIMHLLVRCCSSSSFPFPPFKFQLPRYYASLSDSLWSSVPSLSLPPPLCEQRICNGNGIHAAVQRPTPPSLSTYPNACTKPQIDLKKQSSVCWIFCEMASVCMMAAAFTACACMDVLTLAKAMLDGKPQISTFN